MATYFWVGGTGNWSDSTNHWATASNGTPNAANIPTTTDNVVFDANSNTGVGAFTVTLTAIGNCQNFTASGLDGLMTFSPGTFTLTVTGNISIPASNFATASVAGAWNFTGSGTSTVTTNGVTINHGIQMTGTGTVQLVDNLTMASNRTFTLSSGTLDINNNVLVVGFWSSSGSSTRVVAFGTLPGSIQISATSGTVFSVAQATSLSYTGNSGVFYLTGSAAGTRTIASGSTSGGSSATAASFAFSGSDTISITANSHVGSLDFSGFTGTLAATSFNIYYGSIYLGSTMTLTAGTQTWTFLATSGTSQIFTWGHTLDFNLTFNGLGGIWSFDHLTQGSTKTFTFSNGTIQFKTGVISSIGSFITSGTTLKYLTSTSPGATATISQASGTVTATYLSIRDSTAIGGATFDASAATNVNAGNNTGWSIYVTPLPLLAIGSGITIGNGVSILRVDAPAAPAAPLNFFTTPSLFNNTDGYSVNGISGYGAECVAVNSSGLFVTIGRNGSGIPVYTTSTNGTTWSTPAAVAGTSTQYRFINIAVSSSSRFVAVGNDNSTNIAAYSTSINGSTWSTPVTFPSATSNTVIYSAAVNNSGLFVAVGSDSVIPVYSTSSNGTTWSTPTAINGTTAAGIMTAITVNSSGLFVAVGQDATTYYAIYATSTNGTTWSTPVAMPGQTIQFNPSSICVSSTGRFVAVGFETGYAPYIASGGPMYATSTNGSTWTTPARMAGVTTDFMVRGVAVNTAGTFVAVGSPYGVPIPQITALYSTSTNGSTWSTPTGTVFNTEFYSYYGIAVSPTTGKFVVVGAESQSILAGTWAISN